jgi:thiosulfate dehydrogenase (quinone) large subunit
VSDSARRVGPAAIVAGLARVALGVLWIAEGGLKIMAGFGRADILLVVQSTAHNSRVPAFYRLFTEGVMARLPDLFGVAVPLIELGLGVALVLGVLTLPAALVSAAQLANYWLADQLIAQYPVMAALSAVVAAFAVRASVLSVTSLVLRRRAVPVAPAVRRWL